jgi:hypothetical protein
MKENRDGHLDEMLSSATEVLRDATSESPPPDLARLTIDKIRSLETGFRSTSPARTSHRPRKWSRVLRVSAVAAAVALTAIVAVWWTVVDRAASPAFAQVIEEVAKAKSVTFVSKSEVRTDLNVDVIKEHIRWYVQGQQIRMEEVAGGAIALITDWKQKTVSKLDKKLKKATVNFLVEEFTEHVTDPVKQLQQLNVEDAQLIGEEILDGRTVQVYQLNKVEFLFVRGRGRMKIWVDPATRLPVKIRFEPTRKNVPIGYTEISEFEWNKRLDESLFQIPTDYIIDDTSLRLNRERR